ncbi:MAG TPA: carboxypeptidase regulatory-like domain-containing protein [Gemmatimonadaceae bacterium]
MAAPVRRRQSVLKGFVTNARGVPIEGAIVAVDGASPGGITDASGAFTLRDQPSGSHRLTFRAAGYEPFDIGVNLNSMRVSQIRVSLTEYVPVDK